MKRIIVKIVVVIFLLLFLGEITFSFSSYHTERNKNNLLPVENLRLVGGNIYEDANKIEWELQPHFKNVFHQPEEAIKEGDYEVWYPNINFPIFGDLEHPNLKFLSENGMASHEAILQPDGQFLIKGNKQGTYNYIHPSGFFGSVGHFFADVIPHFINSDYK